MLRIIQPPSIASGSRKGIRIRAAFIAIVAAALAATAVAPSAAAADEALTADDVEDHLHALAESEGDPDALANVEKFRALSASDQERIADYLAEPEVLVEALEVAGETVSSEGRNVTVVNSDIEVVDTVESDSLSPLATSRHGETAAETNAGEATTQSAQLRTARAHRSLSALGVTIMRMSTILTYEVSNQTITAAHDVQAAQRNFVPLASLGASTGAPILQANGWATGSSIWDGSVVYHGLGISVSARQTVTVDGFGHVQADWEPL